MGTHDESAANRGAAASVFESESWQEAQVASNGAEAENKGDNIDECATKRVPGRIKKPHGFVYFVATDNERFVKIGFTEHLDNRLYALRSEIRRQFGCGMRIIGFFPGNYATEQWLQLQVADSRYDTDWFGFTETVHRFIDSLPLLPASHRPHHSLMRTMRRKRDVYAQHHPFNSAQPLQ